MAECEKLSIGKQRKLDKKLLKMQHVLKKEAGVICSTIPTKCLAVCNAGLVNGLTEEILYEFFNKHGQLTDITLLPGKSCCFVSYKKIESAIAAYNNYNGKLNIAQDQKVIYLLFVEEVPELKEQKEWGQLPPGLILLENFIHVTEEENLLKLCTFEEGSSGSLKHRLVKHFGYEFRYDNNNINKDEPLKDSIPQESNFLWTRLSNTDLQFKNFNPDQLTVNHYLPGQGIPHHVDTHSAFKDPIVCVSLGSSVIMEFKKKNKHLCVLLPQRSLLIMSGESRYDWTHGIVPRKFDVVKNQLSEGFTCLKRDTRISFTFREILHGDCTCSYKTNCDSFKKSCQIEDKVASKLETLHVHEIYNNIAEHFSDTRHKPWPNVLEFVQSFSSGSILVDVGCGNGKYLENCKSVFNIGCDRSCGLLNICRQRTYEVFVADCLSIPVKDSTVDGVISIAVIHHLSTEGRRLQAIKEMARILRTGGKALIYVWANDQMKDQKKSSYIKQDRRNRKTNTDILTSSNVENVSLPDGSLSLPVHTNRTNFQAQDVLVPWKLKNENKTTFLRFYHVFEENELEKLCKKLEGLEIKKSFYDQGNWCVVLEKVLVL